MKKPKNQPKTTNNQPDFNTLLTPFLSHPKFLKMKTFRQHSQTSTYDHCISVAKLSYNLNKKLHFKANEKNLITAALLHDFYLYDWHDPNNPTKRHQNNNPLSRLKTAHAFSHANTACKNAIKYFHVNQSVQLAIKSHMWPLNITHFPKSREAFLLSLADKICALRELLHL